MLLHGLVLGVPGWEPFATSEPKDPPVLHASLAPLPEPVAAVAVPVAPPPAPVAARRPKPRPKPAPAADAAPAAVIAMADAPGEPANAAPEQTPPPPAAPADVIATAEEAAPAASQDATAAAAATGGAQEIKGVSIAGWPRHGSIRFRTSMGEGGFVVGEARHEWAHDDKRYTMSVALQTTGMVGIFRTFHYAQRSEGFVGPEGLRPETFSVEQTSKDPSSATFDWSAGQVSLHRGRGRSDRTAPIQRGDQDLLSLWHQIGIVGAGRDVTELTVVSGREATPAAVTVVGAEVQALPIGRLDTLRVRAAARDGRLRIDIWLANSYGMLPVRIRIVDEKGEILDQQAIELRLSPPGSAAEGDGAAGLSDEQNMIELRAEDHPPARPPFGN
ncbi:DUF3108 domain-containing protein [Azoarcus sp. KH32C]|uniref:DUF3108 domain-containing protein n=1 Tax=Azoarcus sp. KH32C TaxID=748247 RepID=UPI000238653D|nr:DUF3108 domain-containing protein [Azoarcus sp. KH32C]BAL25783.1 hypothetical protein AZKH_3495 [Azoarcus sp. KH32C]